MEKKSQLSIFMVIGIVLFLLASFFIYTEKYAIERQSETSLRESAILEGDIAMFQDYAQSTFDTAAYEALYRWGKAGGVDLVTNGEWRHGTFNFVFEDASPRREVAYLKNTDLAADPFSDEMQMLKNNLTGIANLRFNENFKNEVFEEKGYSLSKGEPNMSATLNDGGTTTFSLAPNVLIEKGDKQFPIPEMSVTIETGVNEVLEETNKVIQALVQFELTSPPGTSYNMETYGVPPSPLEVCGFHDNDLNLVRITYDRPFSRSNDPYTFDFLVDTPLDNGKCKSYVSP